MSTYTPTPADVEWARKMLADCLSRTPHVDGSDAAPHLVLGIVRSLLDYADATQSPAEAIREISRARAALQVLEEHRQT